MIGRRGTLTLFTALNAWLVEGNSFKARQALKVKSSKNGKKDVGRSTALDILLFYHHILCLQSHITEPFQLSYVVSVTEIITYCVLCMV